MAGNSVRAVRATQRSAGTYPGLYASRMGASALVRSQQDWTLDVGAAEVCDMFRTLDVRSRGGLARRDG